MMQTKNITSDLSEADAAPADHRAAGRLERRPMKPDGLATKNYWMPFNTSSWRSDPKVRACSLAARGMWFEMLCLMHEASPRGYLRINGHPPTEVELARQVGATRAEVRKYFAELQKHGVFSTAEDGVLLCRRMVREAQKAATNAANGRSGADARWGRDRDAEPHGECDGEPHAEPDSQAIPKEERGKKKEERSTPKPPKGITVAELEAVDLQFARLWQAWPKHEYRKKALEAWRRLRPLPDATFTDRVVASVEEHKRSRDWQKDGGQFIPRAATWINAEGWMNELGPAAIAAAPGRVVADANETRELLASYRAGGGAQ